MVIGDWWIVDRKKFYVQCSRFNVKMVDGEEIKDFSPARVTFRLELDYSFRSK